ncbi:unnamed protein product [Cyprideis torosa]|uniref:Uncharacterized protein n=1 Tax=Cyprideis torosa TaxID=163714 RepID=A0A7R8WBQ5_9CRUS|nr:unnamed protein product [Cyprideis torosa]CAG0887629.1 unnamed protein product [Cyprideis torosa]
MNRECAVVDTFLNSIRELLQGHKSEWTKVGSGHKSEWTKSSVLRDFVRDAIQLGVPVQSKAKASQHSAAKPKRFGKYAQRLFQLDFLPDSIRKKTGTNEQ